MSAQWQVLDAKAVQVARGMLAHKGVYCEIVEAPKPAGPNTFTFVKRNPTTGELIRVTFREDPIQ